LAPPSTDNMVPPFDARHIPARGSPPNLVDFASENFALDGFRGVFVELLGVGESYVLLETTVGTGNRLLRFSSRSPELAYAFFEAELQPPR
jgi:hypothetical protein